jgi:hypothetical protein
MLCFGGVPALRCPLLKAGDHLLRNVPHDELCHVAINASTRADQASPPPNEVVAVAMR